MADSPPQPVAYIMKRYPRYSETFIVNEILAHEAAGQSIEIYSLRAPADTHFQDVIARVRAPVNYLPAATPKTCIFWQTLSHASEVLPDLWQKLDGVRSASARDIYQAVLLALDLQHKNIKYCHAHFASLATTITRMAALFAGIPYSFTAHAKDIFHESVSHEALLQKIQDAAMVITVSDFNLAYLCQCLGFQGQGIEVQGSKSQGIKRLYNGLDLSRFNYASPRQRPHQIVAVGRLVEKKGFKYLVQACALLRERHVAFHCNIIGAGEQEMTLRQQIQDLQLASLVNILGPRPQQEIARLIQDAAVMAAPCVVGQDGNRDGLPTVILESVALGTPVISTDVTGIPEVIEHEQTGLCVAQCEPGELADALQRLLADAMLREQLAGHARQIIEENFDITHNSAQLRAWFANPQADPLPAKEVV